MLQILLAFLAISIVSVTGYNLVEQLTLQTAMQDQRENFRRLDVAAEALSAKLGHLPNREGYFAPLPEMSGAWSRMPSGIGAINVTVENVPFLYCPVAPGTGSGVTVKMPDESASYQVNSEGGLVSAGSFVMNANVSSLNAVAFIVAAGRRSNTPPNCSDIIIAANGRPTIPGGLLRVVGRPYGETAAGAKSSASVDFYVVDGGNGDGRSSDSPTSISKAIAHWNSYQPSSMTIHFSGVNSVDADVWSEFIVKAANSPAQLSFVSNGGGAGLLTSGSDFDVPADFSISAVSIGGARIIAAQGDKLSLSGSLTLAPVGSGPALIVLAGSRVSIASGEVSFNASGRDGIQIAGDVSLTNGGISGNVNTLLWLVNGGRVSTNTFSIGSSGSRPGTIGIYADGAWDVSSVNSSVAAGSNGCWASTYNPTTNPTGDMTFSYSSNGTGSYSIVTDPTPLAVDPVPTEDEKAVYRAAQDDRRAARRSNHSNFQCI